MGMVLLLVWLTPLLHSNTYWVHLGITHRGLSILQGEVPIALWLISRLTGLYCCF